MIRSLVAVEPAEAVKPFEPLVRPRVQERLAAAFAYRVALVVAPPGFGKSVAVRHFFDAARVPHVRFALRREHATLLGFVRGLVAALEAVAPGAGKNLVTAYERASSSAAPAAELAGWVAAWLGPYVGTVILDDCHIAAADPLVDEFISELVDRTPHNVRWALLTRASGGLPIATWLAYGAMDLPVDEVDLRFDADEAAAMARAAGVAMRPDDLNALLLLTNGWPTAFAFGLRLSTRAVQIRQVEAGTRDMVYRYLAEQMLGGLTDAERTFLVRTCVLPNVDLDVLGADGSAGAFETIERLRKKTSFISAESDRVFRYHELFRDYLEHELRARDPEGHRAIVASSAALLERAGRPADALALALAGGSLDVIARVLVRSGTELIERGYIDVIEKGLAALAPAQRATDWRLSALHASVASSRGRHDDADALYAAALEATVTYDERADVAQQFTVALGRRYEHERAAEVIGAVDAEAVGDERIALKVLSARAMTLLMRRDSDAAKPLMGLALEKAVRLGDETLRATLCHWSAIVALDTGEIDDAEVRAAEAVAYAERQGLAALAARASTTLAEIALQRADSAARQWSLVQAGRFAERAGDANVALFALYGLYDLACERGDATQLSELEGKIKQTTGLRRYVDVGVLSGVALQASWNNDFATARDVLDDTFDHHETASRAALRLAETSLYAAAAGRRAEAERLAARCAVELGAASASELRGARAIKAAVLRSLALTVLGKRAMANAALRALEGTTKAMPVAMRALVRAARALYVHVETGSDHHVLAAALLELRQRDLGGFARLLEALPLPEQSREAGFAALTQTEIRVLRSLATGASSKDVAAELGRSALTIDSHVKAIARKLSCKGRLEAVSLAREHGIL